MIAKNYIENNISELDKLYNDTTSNQKKIYYCKLALLELCGWIEESMDKVIICYCNQNLTEAKNKKFVKEFIKRNSGFLYEEHFRQMLIKLIGICSTERLEKKLERKGSYVSTLSSLLVSLKIDRNRAAHNYTKSGITQTYNSPSYYLGEFNKIYPLLKIIDYEIRNI